MSAEVNKGVVRRMIEEVWKDHDLTNIDELVAGDYFDHMAVPEYQHGIAGAKHVINWLVAVFPDHRFDIVDAVADEDTVAVRGTCSGTHEGDLWASRRRASVSPSSRSTGCASQTARWRSIGRSGTISA